MGFRENLKSELAYSGMLVKELASKSGVKKFSIDNYLNARGQIPSVEIAVRIARALDVSVEYLVMGTESKKSKSLSPDLRLLLQSLEELNEEDRKVIIKNALNLIDTLINRNRKTHDL